jgi:cobalt-precorrin-7 (C5)-methyltransferase
MTALQSYKHPQINICGIGPGNPDLILPVVFRLVEASNVVVGGNRHLAIFDLSGKKVLKVQNDIPEIIQKVKQAIGKQITVLVSGDTGFHSLLRSFQGHFTADELHVVPGISTYQYFFAKIALTYEDAWIGSVHGMLVDFIEKVKNNRKVFLLTDAKTSWKHIAESLSDNKLGECTMYVGNRLSYPDETIVKDTANRLKTKGFDFELCAVIIINEYTKDHE